MLDAVISLAPINVSSFDVGPVEVGGVRTGRARRHSYDVLAGVERRD